MINKKTFKSDFPSCFVHEGVEITGTKIIADKFNECFTEIEPKLTKSINTANKAPFNSYLTTLCPASYNFGYTKPDDIEKIIRNLRPKSRARCDNISTKLLKEIENVVSRPLSIIINQSLCTGIFPDKLKIAKVIPLYKKMTINSLEIAVLYPYSLPYQKFLKGLPLTNYTTIFHLMAYFMKASMDSASFTPPN